MQPPDTVRLIRIFVSSPGDVAEERAVLDEAIQRINGTQGQTHGVRLELWKWEWQVVPQIGPRPQAVVDAQTQAYDLYLGIMSSRFGTPTDTHGSGTEKEFRDAAKRWGKVGRPWILFYFDDKPTLSSEPADVQQYLQVCTFRKELQKLGIVGAYTGVRGSSIAFFEQVDHHLRLLIQSHLPIPRPAGRVLGKKKKNAAPSKTPRQPVVVPPAYVDSMNNASRQATVPIVFVSSTAEDLKQHRTAAKDAAIAAGCLPRMMEYFAASGDKPPLDACLAKVSEADVLVVIVAHRFGWVPPDQKADQHKSITWLECERAAAEGREILAFLLEETHPWPEEAREEYAVTEALREGKATPELLQSVQGNVTSLRQFKAWLNNRAIRATFTTPEQLHGKVLHALHEWRQRQPGLAPAPAKRDRPPANPTAYLRSLLERNAFIDIRGLQVGAGKAYRFPIEDLFISLTTTGRPHAPDEAPGGKEAKRGSDERGMAASTVLPLHAALAHRLLVVVGDPGSGKTTFVRRVACALAESLLGDVPNAAEARLGLKDTPLPLSSAWRILSNTSRSCAAGRRSIRRAWNRRPGSRIFSRRRAGRRTGDWIRSSSRNGSKTAPRSCSWTAWTKRRIAWPAGRWSASSRMPRWPTVGAGSW